MSQLLVLTGKLPKEPEMHYTSTGLAYTTFSIPDNYTWTKDGEKKQRTTWFRVTAWGKQAEICKQYLNKGSMVYVEGKLLPDEETGNPRIWKTDDGTPKTSYEVRLENVRFLAGPSNGGGQTTPAANLQEEEDLAF